MGIVYDDSRKDLPSEKLHELFIAVGWSDGSETADMIKNYNVPFVNSTLVISAWEKDRLIAMVRVLSDKMFRSVIYDLLVLPELQNRGIGRELVRRCIEHYPNSEWLVGTTTEISGFYEKIGFKRSDTGENVFLSIPCKLFTHSAGSAAIAHLENTELFTCKRKYRQKRVLGILTRLWSTSMNFCRRALLLSTSER